MSYRVVRVEEGGSYEYSLSDGETFENVLIDVSEPGADLSINAVANGWTIRNVAVVGEFSVGGGLGEEPRGGTNILRVGVPDETSQGHIENCYFGDGVEVGYHKGCVFFDSSHSGSIHIDGVNIGGWSVDALHASELFVEDPAGAGWFEVLNSYFHNNNISHARVMQNGAYFENCVFTNDNNVPVLPRVGSDEESVINSRGISVPGGSPDHFIELVDCEIDIRAGNTCPPSYDWGPMDFCGGFSIASAPDGSTVDVQGGNVRNEPSGNVNLSGVGDSPNTSPPPEVPTDPLDAVDGDVADPGVECDLLDQNITQGDTAEVEVEVSNPHRSPLVTELSVKSNGSVIDTFEETLDPGEIRTLTIDVSISDTGEFDIHVEAVAVEVL